jgi:hypothetical protein
VGVGYGFDIGFRYGGGMLYEVGYSIWKKPSSQATLALQYSQSEYKLPSYLEKLQDILSLEFKRKDFVMPLIMGRKFGENGKYGGIHGGPVLGYTKISYGFDPRGIYERVAETEKTPLPSIPTQVVNYFSYGLNGSVKLGYKHVFALISLSSYYQDYGTYKLPGVGDYNPSGLTIIPYFGFVVQ